MLVMPEEDFLTPAEIAKKLRIAEESVTRLLRQGKLPGVKIAGFWRIDRQEFQDFLADLKRQQQKK